MWVVDDVKNIKRCAVMGQHTLQFPWGFDEEDDGCIRIKIKLTQCITALYRMGIREYQVACDPGIGLYTAEVIHSLKSQCPNIQIVCVLPHEEQATKLSGERRSNPAASAAFPRSTSPTFSEKGSSKKLICFHSSPLYSGRTQYWSDRLRPKQRVSSIWVLGRSRVSRARRTPERLAGMLRSIH